MALSGSFNTNKYNSKIGLTLSWTATQSIANNTTTIKWTLKSNGGGSGNWWYAGPVTVVIAGKTVLSQTSRFKMYGSGAYKKTGSLTVSHNNDGTKSVSMSVKAAIYSSSVNCTGSHSYTLNTIPRYASITSVTNFNDTGYPTIVYENLAGSSVVTDLKARLMWTVNGTDYYTPFVNLNVAGGTYTFNSTSLPQSEKNRMLSACALSNTLAFKVDLQSSLNGTLGHNYKEATMNVVNANPIAPSTPLSYREANDTIYNNITHDRLIIVQNQSTLEITINDYTGAKYAAIFDYTLKFNGVSYTIFSSDPNRTITITKPNINGTFAAQLTVTDSRLNKSTASLNIPIKAWSAPTADRRIARRNSFEDDTIINVTGHISSIKNSQQEELNTMTIQERHQQKGTSNWSSWITLTSGQDTTVILDNSYEWNVQITVTDKFTTTTYSSVVGTGKPLMIYDIKRKSIGINGIPTADKQLYVEEGMTVPAHGQSYVNPTHKSAVYVPKTYQTNQWFPVVMTQTYGGGQWSIGTYNNEELLFVYTTKYNVDNNVNTNQIWRLQLAKNDNSSADNKIITSDGFVGTNVVSTNTLSEIFVRSSGGTAIEAAFRRWGRVCTLYLHFKTTATTSGGGNMIVGTVGSKVTPYLPPMIVTAGSYYSSMALGGHLDSQGNITVRNASGSNIGAQSSGFRMTWTWVY